MISEKLRGYAQDGVNFGLLVLVCLWGISFFINESDLVASAYIMGSLDFYCREGIALIVSDECQRFLSGSEQARITLPWIFTRPYDFVSVLIAVLRLRWVLFIIGGITSLIYLTDLAHGERYRYEKAKGFYNKWGIYSLILLTFLYYTGDRIFNVVGMDAIYNFFFRNIAHSREWDEVSRLYFSDISYIQAFISLLVFLGDAIALGIIFNLAEDWVLQKTDLTRLKRDKLKLIWSKIRQIEFTQERILYCCTFGIEMFLLFMRYVILFVPTYLLVFFTFFSYFIVDAGFYGGDDWNATAWGSVFYDSRTITNYVLLGFGSTNLISSLLVFFGINLPIRNIQLSFDSREPTKAEGDYIANFYKSLPDQEIVFNSWNVIESAGAFAFTYGRNIFISRGAFSERHFNALVAHEIGHLHNRDGLILQALHNFTYPLFNHLLFNPSTIQRGTIDPSSLMGKQDFLLSGMIHQLTITFFTLMFGGWGVQALARFWSRFYIERDYQADEYAHRLGFGYDLINYLEEHKDFDTALPLFSRWRGYTSVRIERLYNLVNVTPKEE